MYVFLARNIHNFEHKFKQDVSDNGRCVNGGMASAIRPTALRCHQARMETNIPTLYTVRTLKQHSVQVTRIVFRHELSQLLLKPIPTPSSM